MINNVIYFRFLDMHMYITSALQRTDMKAVGLQLAMDLLHEKVCLNNELCNKVIAIFNILLFLLHFRKNVI